MRSIAGDLLLHRLEAARAADPTLPRNRALYECLRQAILDGRLPASARLPPSRDLSDQLGVSRNTVLHAYEQLQAEGYVRGLTGSGTFVTDAVPDGRLFAGTPPPGPAAPARAPALSRRGQALVARSPLTALQWGAFVPGVPDVTRFPHERFARIAARLWRKPPPQQLSYSHGGGHPGLRQALAVYLKQARSVECDADQIVITQGAHQAIDLVVRLLGNPGDVAWLEEPGYRGIRSAIDINGLRTKALPVDSEGLRLPRSHRGQPPKFIFVTPSHQYPLGSVMSLARRAALLEHATRHASWIVEDDYDSEFRFGGRPVPSLQGLVPQSPVIYVGTFSKTTYPGIRTAYLVLPKALVPAFRTAHSELYREGHLVEQAALAELMLSGHYAAHIRRMRLVYAARRSFLLSLVHKWLGPGWLHEHDSDAGLHLVLTLPDDVHDTDIAVDALAHGVVVRPLSTYYHGGAARQGLLLGFACVREADMPAPFEALVRCIARATARSSRSA